MQPLIGAAADDRFAQRDVADRTIELATTEWLAKPTADDRVCARAIVRCATGRSTQMSPKRSRGLADVTHQSDGAGRPDHTIAPPSKPLVLAPSSRPLVVATASAGGAVRSLANTVGRSARLTREVLAAWRAGEQAGERAETLAESGRRAGSKQRRSVAAPNPDRDNLALAAGLRGRLRDSSRSTMVFGVPEHLGHRLALPG